MRTPSSRLWEGIVRLSNHLSLCCVCATFIGCAAMPDHLSSLMTEGTYERALKDGQTWLDRADSRELTSPQGLQIFRLVAVARLRIAQRADTVSALERFRLRYTKETALKDLTQEAKRREAHLYYRQETLKRDAVISYGRFRAVYPHASDVNDSMKRELKAGLRDARALADITVFKAFRTHYCLWPMAASACAEAKQDEATLAYKTQAEVLDSMEAYGAFRKNYPEAKEIPAARAREFELAVDRATTEDMVLIYKQFRSDYSTWPEAHGVLPKMYEREARRALADTASKGEESGFSDFRKDYPEEPWVDAADRAQIAVVFAPFRRAITAALTVPPDIGKLFVDGYGTHRFLTETVQDLKEVLRSRLADLPDRWTARLFRAAFPNDPASKTILASEIQRAWAATQTQGNKELYGDFFRWYPTSENALSAEQSYYHLDTLWRQDRSWPRPQVRSIRRLPQRQTEYIISVRDCRGAPVSGLYATDFSLYEGRQPLGQLTFRGAEAVRPLDLTFNLDLSGSMLVERNALHAAIPQFAYILQIRNRPSRFGLLGFSDRVKSTHGFSEDIGRFQKHLTDLPLTESNTGVVAVGALAQSVQMSTRSRAERAAIVLTDRNLRVNTLGREQLGLPMGRTCKTAHQARACLSRCLAKKPKKPVAKVRCISGCISRFDKPMGRRFQRCVTHGGADLKDGVQVNDRKSESLVKAQCLRAMDYGQVLRDLDRCTKRVKAGSKVMGRLAKRINGSGLRTFYLIPPTEGATQGPMNGFSALAQNAYGQIVSVPPAAAESKPYVAALMSVANELSTQYVFSRKQKKKPSALAPKVVIRPGYIWQPVGLKPPGRVLLMASLDSAGDCPGAMAVTAKKGVFRQAHCGGPWVEQVTPIEQVNHIQMSGQTLYVFGGNNTVYRSEPPWKQFEPVTIPSKGPIDILSVGDRLVLLGMKPNDVPGVWAYTGATKLWQEWPLPASFKLDGEPHLFSVKWTKKDRICLLGQAKTVWCHHAEPDRWSHGAMVGLDINALAKRGQIQSPPDRLDVALFASADGIVYRSIDGGARWHAVTKHIATSPALSFSGGQTLSTCVLSSTGVQCSKTGGVSWFPVGNRFKAADHASLTSTGHDLNLGHGKQMYRLHRMVSRDVLSSAHMFEPGTRDLKAGVHPILMDISQRMKAENTLLLRVSSRMDHGDEALKLVTLRVESIRQYFIEKGISHARIEGVLTAPGRTMPSHAPLIGKDQIELRLHGRPWTNVWRQDQCEMPGVESRAPKPTGKATN
jgi:hypothetical protein